MGTDKLRKYVLPNIPYLFVLWAFLKLGTAYRLAAGAGFAHKFINTFSMISALWDKTSRRPRAGGRWIRAAFFLWTGSRACAPCPVIRWICS